MDSFFEQIVAIRKGLREYAITLAIWLGALILAGILFFVTVIYPFISTIGYFLIFLVFLFAVKLTKKLSIEYEYIFTNGTLDVDKIIAKNSRKRMLSFDVSEIDALGKYNQSIIENNNFDKKIIACNIEDRDAYYIVKKSASKGKRLLVFAPDERIKGAIKSFLPRYMQNSAFKD